MGFLSKAAAAVIAGLVALAALPAAAQPWRYTDEDVAVGFEATVFGSEHGQSRYALMVKKFNEPVRIRLYDGASKRRHKAVSAFVRSLPKLIPGLDIRLAGKGEAANFDLHVVDRAAYADTARRHVFGNPHARVPGRCLVKVDVGETGIRRSVAVIVSDEGDRLFRRCLVEEVLQGLGPMNDDRRLSGSVFNDETDFDRLMPFDRAILSILYDRRVRHGMSAREARAVLSEVIATATGRLR